MRNIDDTVAEVLRLDAQATRGPWDYWFEVGTRLGPDREHPIALVKQMRRARCPGAGGAGVDADAALISHYRTAAPALAREVQRLQGEVERLRLEHAEERLVSCCEGHDLGYDAGCRAGQEAMRERCMKVCSELILRARVCAGDDEGLRDLRCLESHMLQAIRALEVSDD